MSFPMPRARPPRPTGPPSPGATFAHSRGTLADLMAPDADPQAAADKVTKARSILVADYPWFGTLATRLHVLPRPSIGTLATDGTRLIYAPAFVLKQPMPELLGGIAHEVLHCGLLHPFRFDGHDHAEWNISCDYAINGILIDAGFTLPKGSLHDPRYRGMSAEQIYAKRRAEAAQNPPPPEPPDGEGEERGEEGEPGGEQGDEPRPNEEDGPDEEDDEGEPGGEGENDDDEGEGGEGDEPTDEPAEGDDDDDQAEEDGPGGDEPTDEPAEPKTARPGPDRAPDDATGRMLPAPPKGARPDADDQAGDEGDGEPRAGESTGEDWSESDWMVAAAEATMLAAKAGKDSAGASRAAEATREAVTDWREVLRRFIDQATSRDQSWMTPNRRYIAGGLYLPGNTPTDAPRLGVLVDTSGSIDAECLNQFASELDGIMREVRPEAVDVVYCDAAVAGVQEFTPDGGQLELTPAGGGGTDMDPGFAWFNRRADEGAPVCAVVCFTDLEFWSLPQEPEGYPVLWVCYPWVKHIAPFGETVRLNG